MNGWSWCWSCLRPCPGLDADGFCRWREIGEEAEAVQRIVAAGDGADGDGTAAPVDGGGDGNPRPEAGGEAPVDALPGEDAAETGAGVPAGVRPLVGAGASGEEWPETLTRWQAAARGAWRYQVCLDGEPVKLAFRADAEAGEVVVTLTNARGICWGCLDGQQDRRETRTGRVEIRRRTR